jgi:uncharacterized protein (DUF2141 family)
MAMGQNWLPKWWWVWALCSGVAACATVQTPDGGPKDTQPPKLLFVDPPNEQLNFKSKTITLTFDEFLKTTELTSNLFISPLLEPPPTAYAQNKRIHIRLPHTLKDSTTYVITLFQGIKDDNEGNSLAAPIRYAFSTGSSLDGGKVIGQVIDAQSEKPSSGWIVALYDSPADSGFYNQKPAYATQTDAGGQFELTYLKPGAYRLLAFFDKDRNFRLNLPTEGLAFLQQDEIRVDSNLSGLLLRSFQPDVQAPRLKQIVRPTPFSLVLEFDEIIEAGAILEVENRRDTLRHHPNGTPNRLIAAWPDSSFRDSVNLTLLAVVDTAGNRRDSTYRLKWPKPLNDSTFQLIKLDTIKELRQQGWMADAPLDFKSLVKSIRVETPDSMPIKYELSFEPPFRFIIELKQIPEDLERAIVYIDSNLKSDHQLKIRKELKESWNVKGWHKAGSIAGKWNSDSLIQVVIELYNFNTKEKKYSTTAEFRFNDLLPAPYQIRVLLDRDGNGRWTPGNMKPKRMPEMWYTFPELVNLKLGWQIEGIEIKWPPPEVRNKL